VDISDVSGRTPQGFTDRHYRGTAADDVRYPQPSRIALPNAAAAVSVETIRLGPIRRDVQLELDGPPGLPAPSDVRVEPGQTRPDGSERP
jgi:hypothetical protein